MTISSSVARAALLFWLTGTSMSALAVTAPVQFATSEAGVVADSPQVLLVALPIINVGTATALRVQISGVTLASANRLASTILPVDLGDIPEDGRSVLNAQFDSTKLLSTAKYRLTATGTYQVNNRTLGFSVNRNVTLPPQYPRTVHARTHSLTSIDVEGDDFPVPPGAFEESNVEEGPENPDTPPIPVSPRRILFPIVSAATPDVPAPGPVGTATPDVDFEGFARYGSNAGTPPDPSGASSDSTTVFQTTNGGLLFVENHVVLATANTYGKISTDGGNTFPKDINVGCSFGFRTCDASGNRISTRLDGDVCCDQVAHYIPSLDSFVWLIQTWPKNWRDGQNGSDPNAVPPVPPRASGNNRLRLIVISTEELRRWANRIRPKFKIWDITPSGVDLQGKNDWFDYSDISVGSDYLYVSTDVLSPTDFGLLVVRFPIADLLKASLNYEFAVAADNQRSQASHLSQNQSTGSALTWAGHVGTNKLLISNWPEHADQYDQFTVNVNSYKNDDYVVTTPSGKDWLKNGSRREDILGAVRVLPTHEVWFAWGAGRDDQAGRPQPYVRIVKLDSNTFALKDQVDLWSSDYAFGYPALAANARGEVGAALFVGGPDREVHTSVGFPDDLAFFYVATSDGTNEARIGDYLTIRPAGPNAEKFSAFGYNVVLADPSKSTSCDVTPGCNFAPLYVRFGRKGDIPPAPRAP